MVSGKAIRIDNDGALVILENNRQKRVIAGDVIHK